MSNKGRAQVLIPVAILVIGIVGAVLMAKSRQAPPRQERIDPGPLVEVVAVEQEAVSVTVSGHGEVVPKVAVDVVPQVTGRVVRVHRSLVAGGFFRAGEALVVIEARDYELAVDRAQASVARAEVALETQKAEAAIAHQEWDAIHPGEAPPSGLVVREPQVRQAEAELAAAQADLAVAQLNLARTRVTVPFDGVVVSKSVDSGQFVATGQKVARVYGTRAVEVRVPLEDDELAWFETPGYGSTERGPEAQIRMTTGGREHTWVGRVVRQEAEIDPVSRMVHVVIEVADPFNESNGRPALRPGSFVEVEIGGTTLEDVVSVPRYAVHEGDTVWVVEDGALKVRQVSVARADRINVLIESGLESGDLLVVSSLEVVTDGMRVRFEDGSTADSGIGSSDAREAVQ
jgi:RND family efflux transporter MFP subunit